MLCKLLVASCLLVRPSDYPFDVPFVHPNVRMSISIHIRIPKKTALVAFFCKIWNYPKNYIGNYFPFIFWRLWQIIMICQYFSQVISTTICNICKPHFAHFYTAWELQYSSFSDCCSLMMIVYTFKSFYHDINIKIEK